MTQPKVSVIIPVYNVEAYLPQCLDSVIGQTLTDIEILAVDDGSPDDCGMIIDGYAARDPRIKAIHQQNGGYGKAINAGLSAASGEYIAIIESDDWAEPDMLQVLYETAARTGSKVVKGSFTKIYKDRASHECSLAHICGGIECTVKPAKNLELMIYESSIWSAIYDRGFLQGNKIAMLETPGAGYQDVVWKFMVYSLCEDVVIVSRPVYNYRVFAAGSSSVSKDKALAMFRNYSVIREHLERYGKFELFKESYYVHQIFDCVFHVNRLSREGREYFYTEARNMIKEAEDNGFDIASIRFNDDVNDYVTRHVIPLYNSIKNQQLHNAEIRIVGRKILRNLFFGIRSIWRRIVDKAKMLLCPVIPGCGVRKINRMLERQNKTIDELTNLVTRQTDLVNRFWVSQSDAWERNWKEFELAGRNSDLRDLLDRFWSSQSDAWERNWKEFELAGRNSDLRDLLDRFWSSQSDAWEHSRDTLAKLDKNSNRLVVSIPVGAIKQYEYYIRANESTMDSKIAKFKEEMDADSVRQVDKYFGLFKMLPNNFEGMTEFSFPLFMDCFTDEERFLLCNYDVVMARIRDSYAALDTSEIPLSLNAHYFECGIKLLPNRISEGFAGKVAIDCGAWVGDTAIPISRYGFRKVHCFEPMPDTYEILQQNIQKNKLDEYISCHNYAVGRLDGSVKMKHIGSQAEGALLAGDGDIEVHQTKIDDFINQADFEDVALIKIDVEGVELDALKGAEGVIRTSKPVLLVSVYHTWVNPEQLFEVKDYIESLDLDYKFKFKGMQPEKGLIYEYGLICYS